MDDVKTKPTDHLKPFQFPKNTSGNPGGRPKGLERTAREAMKLREYTAKNGVTYKGVEAAFACLLDMFFDDKANMRERIAAFKEWCDRGYGKAKQTVKIEDDAAGSVAAMPRDPAEMPDEDIREALKCIGTLKRLAVVRGGTTEH